ncbi:MAG: hypothetical protein VX498_04235 [Myxococcota bacterium]|nr:hypothetical protein [Myxococcota bacterium]
MKKHLHWLLLLPLFAVLGEQQLDYMGYVKDDTFISMRYARNLATGHGMVFNYGQKLEGYTNFLWVILTVPAYWLKVDPLTWVKGMGCLFGQLGIVVTYALGRHLAGDRSDLFAWLAAAGYAFSASVVLWSTAGLEPTLMAVLCSGGTLFGMRLAARSPGDPGARKDALIAGLLLAAAGLTRPDAHAVVLVAAAAGVIDALRRRDKFRPWLLCAGVITAILGPYHLWRILYFGELLPNTFYIKAAAGPEVWEQGRQFALGLLGFTSNSGFFALAALSFLVALVTSLLRLRDRSAPSATAEGSEEPAVRSRLSDRNPARYWAFVLAVLFLLYLVKIGRDEMKWYRLYLPVFPLVLALGSDGLRWVAGGVHRAAGTLVGLGRGLRVGLFLAWLPVVLGLAWLTFSLNNDLLEQKRDWHNRYVDSSKKSFQAMGAYISARSEPGDVVLFQDMGAAPFSAGELRWVDTIGILDRTVAREHAAIGLNPFMRGLKRRSPGGAEAISDLDKRLRDYFFDQDPDWIAMVAYVGKRGGKRKKIRRSFRKAKGDKEREAKLFINRVKSNAHAHGIARDRRFRDHFSYEKAWMRNRGGYWLVLYRRNEP